jgi:hypothetical protein
VTSKAPRTTARRRVSELFALHQVATHRLQSTSKRNIHLDRFVCGRHFSYARTQRQPCASTAAHAAIACLAAAAAITGMRSQQWCSSTSTGAAVRPVTRSAQPFEYSDDGVGNTTTKVWLKIAALVFVFGDTCRSAPEAVHAGSSTVPFQAWLQTIPATLRVLSRAGRVR